MPGIIASSFDLPTQTATVTFDPQQVAEAAVRAALVRANAGMAQSPLNPKNQPPESGT